MVPADEDNNDEDYIDDKLWKKNYYDLTGWKDWCPLFRFWCQRNRGWMQVKFLAVNKQASKQTNKQVNKPTNKQTKNKQTSK